MKLLNKALYFIAVNLFLNISLVSFVAATEQWIARGDGVQVQSEGDTKTYRFTSGYLDSNIDSFKNGIIEFEFKPSHQRAFFYVYFRQHSSKESEVVYIRTHKSNAPDTLQYSPVFQGKSAWQLYHSERGNAAATLPNKGWVKVKLQVMGNQLTMWVGDNPKANIKNMLMTGNYQAGSISFRGFIPRGSLAKQTALLRNINIQHLPDATPEVSNPESIEQGVITQYRVSPAFSADSKSAVQIPKQVSTQKWDTVATNSQGLLELLRHRPIPKGARIWAVAADVSLFAEQATQCQMNVGFSDALTLWLNEQPLIFANASYRYRNARQQGLMTGDQMTVFLQLKQGVNTVRAIVADSFGGWGLQTRLMDCNAVSVVESSL